MALTSASASVSASDEKTRLEKIAPAEPAFRNLPDEIIELYV